MDAPALAEVRRVLLQAGFDLSAYTDNFIERRLTARMRNTQSATLFDYAAVLAQKPDERRFLMDSLSINVTNFFRDEVFCEAALLPALQALTKLAAGRQIIAWSAGCASGQEAYSLAILLEAYLAKVGWAQGFRVYASDISQHALQVAMKGLYPKEMLDSVPAGYRRYFRADMGAMRVSDSIRSRIHFQRHDLRDVPPVPSADLILCRNVMIYLTLEAKGAILQRFHRCLVRGGYLLLGSAEIILDPRLFRSVDVRHKIYQRAAQEV